jgi:hypothetical protein
MKPAKVEQDEEARVKRAFLSKKQILKQVQNQEHREELRAYWEQLDQNKKVTDGT